MRTPSGIKELPPIGTPLSDHLLWQPTMQTEDEAVKDIGGAIVGNLDDDGYLVASVEEIAAMGEWPVAEVEKALQHVQMFIGVAARDFQECLWLQLRHLGLEGTPSDRFVTEHGALQNHQVPDISSCKSRAADEELKQHIEIILIFDPKPGSRYNPSQLRDPGRLRGQGRGP